MTATTETLMLDATKGSSLIIKIVAVAVLLFIGWAAFAWVDEIVRGEGEVVSSSRAQIVQNLEGGILAELHVHQGDRVKAGELLAKLQDTKFQTAVDDLQDQIDALEIKRIRLEAELEGAFDFDVPAELAHIGGGEAA